MNAQIIFTGLFPTLSPSAFYTPSFSLLYSVHCINTATLLRKPLGKLVPKGSGSVVVQATWQAVQAAYRLDSQAGAL